MPPKEQPIAWGASSLLSALSAQYMLFLFYTNLSGLLQL